MSSEQREDVVSLFGKKTKLVNSIDYVSGWFYKASEYMQGTEATCAFVSTNSISQGQQVFPVWNTIRSRFEVHINFAWTTFVWNSEASSKAHVHVVIIGFSAQPGLIKRIFGNSGVVECKNLNPYLRDASDVLIDVVAKPISPNVPNCDYGSLINDKGNYIFTQQEVDDFLKKEPAAVRFVRPFMGSQEFINGTLRYILYLRDASSQDIESMPFVRERVEAVRAFRLASSASATRKSGERPHAFFYDSTCSGNFLLIPRTSSERRMYIPVGFMSPDVVASDATSIVPDATLYHFGVVTSQFHNAWMRVVAGRLKSDYRYAPKTVYNTFPWPNPTQKQREYIEHHAQNVLDVREQFPDKSLADLYDPDKMPDALRQAHHDLDIAVEVAYGVDFAGDEEKIVAHLFKLYAEMAGE